MSTEHHTPMPDEEEKMICPSCHHHNHPDTKYCAGCGAPLGPTAAWGPWEQTQAEGFVLRQATTGRPKLIVIFGVWLLSLPVFIVLSFVIIEHVRRTDWSFGDTLSFLVCVFIWFISGALIYRTTANYVTKRRIRTDENDT